MHICEWLLCSIESGNDALFLTNELARKRLNSIHLTLILNASYSSLLLHY